MGFGFPQNRVPTQRMKILLHAMDFNMIRHEQNFTTDVPAGEMYTGNNHSRSEKCPHWPSGKYITGIWGRKDGKTSKQTNEG